MPITRDELAARFGVEPTTVSNYVKRGMPATRKGRFYEFEPEACEKWLRENRDHEGQFANMSRGPGGKRPGAGRPRKDATQQAEKRAEAKAPETAPEQATGTGIIGKEGKVRVAVTSDAYIKMLENGISPADNAATTSALETLKRIQEYEIKSGKLVDAEKIADELKRRCEWIRNSMLKLSGIMGQRAGELGLDQAGGAKLKAMLHTETVRLLDSVREEARGRV